MARAVLRRVRGVTSATIRASKTRNWPTIVNHWPPGSNNAGLISLSDFERRSAFHQARPQLPPPAILLRLLCTVVVQVRAWVDKRVHRVTRWTHSSPWTRPTEWKTPRPDSPSGSWSIGFELYLYGGSRSFYCSFLVFLYEATILKAFAV